MRPKDQSAIAHPRPAPALRARRFVRRTLAVSGKEVAHVVRDPATLFIALGLPVVLLLIFGYGISFDLDRSRLAVVDDDRSPASRDLVESLTASGEFQVAATPRDAAEVDGLFRSGEASAAVVVPPGYGRDLAAGRAAPLQILVDGSDGTKASGIIGTMTALLRAHALKIAGPGVAPAVEPRVALLYNPGLKSTVFFVPGLVAFILAIAGVLLTALTIAREEEQGNLEQLFATPVGRLEVVLGKLLPYVALGVVQALLVLSAGAWFFDVPLVGSPWLLAVGTLLFLVAALSHGLFVSVIAHSQQVATQVGALSSLLPAVMLSGFMIPVASMPLPLQVLASVFPARYFVTLLRGVLLKGSGWAELWPQLAAMALFSTVLLSVATRKFRRRVA
jgi:ABC-2 type transport system permease protein